MIDPALLAFGHRYCRLLKTFSWLARCGLARPRSAAIRRLGRWLSPYKAYRAKIQGAMESALPLANSDAAWLAWLDNHTRFVTDFLAYPTMDARWVKENVSFESADVFSQLCAGGGLFLTFHTHHQNTLACLPGLAGASVSAVAAAPAESPLYPVIGHWAEQLNRSSACHFNGGEYLFTNDLRGLAKKLRHAFTAGQVVVCLADVNQGDSDGATVELLGRRIAPPTGVIEMALRLNVPVFAGILSPRGQGLVLKTVRIETQETLNGTLRAYFSLLEQSIIADPACWQGWEWFSDLPVIAEHQT
jgi:lauroyl/myristoyl acyltransferase